MARAIIRILLGALLPIPLMVAIFTLICDLFYFNKDGDYIRLADSQIGHIAMDYIFYLILGLMYLGIPCLIYSIILEWRRRTGGRYFPVSLALGARGVWGQS